MKSLPHKMFQRDLSGFSLIEILLVVILLGVCAGLTLPNFSQTYKNLRLKKCASDLAYLMRYAQNRSITFDRQLQLEFDSDFKNYTLKEDISEGGDNPEFGRIKNRFGQSVAIPSEIQAVAEEQRIRFYPDGRMDKMDVSLCQEKNCYIVSTKKKRGAVDVLPATNVD